MRRASLFFSLLFLTLAVPGQKLRLGLELLHPVMKEQDNKHLINDSIVAFMENNWAEIRFGIGFIAEKPIKNGSLRASYNVYGYESKRFTAYNQYDTMFLGPEVAVPLYIMHSHSLALEIYKYIPKISRLQLGAGIRMRYLTHHFDVDHEGLEFMNPLLNQTMRSVGNSLRHFGVMYNLSARIRFWDNVYFTVRRDQTLRSITDPIVVNGNRNEFVNHAVYWQVGLSYLFWPIGKDK